MSAFMGMVGNGDWADDQRPENWRQMTLHEFPNGDAPITAVMSMMKSEKTDDSIFHWWTKRLPSQAADVTNIYTDAGLATAYVFATHQATHGIANATVYVKIAEAKAKEFRAGHTVVMRDASEYDVDVVGKVTQVVYNGASSYVAVKLSEIDDNAATPAAGASLQSVDRIIIKGNVNPEGGPLPRAVSYLPVKYTGYTQIFRTPLEMTRTAKKTRLRTGNQVEEAKREALELHSIEQEKEMIWGVGTDGIGNNGKPETTQWGILPWVRTNATNVAATGDSSVADYTKDTAYAGQTWLDGGEDWFDQKLEYLSTYCASEMIMVCGAGVLTGLAKLAKYTGNIQMQPGPNKTYGMRFRTWDNMHVTLHIKKHPLLAREVSTKYSAIIYDPKNIVDRVIDDTQYLPDRGARGIDGEASEYLTEHGPEFHFPDQFMFLNGIGEDNDS